MKMIASDDMPQELLDWVKAHAQGVGDEVAAVSCIIVMYDAMDSDGDTYWNYSVMGENGAIRVTGLLELVKLRLLTPHIQQGLDQGGNEDTE